ncbi:MAG: peptidase S10 [Pseudomonadota bacterium]
MSKSGASDSGGVAKSHTSSGRLRLSDKDISYDVNAAWLTLKKAEKPTAEIFHTYYREGGRARRNRPLTFVFNGGPGAASAYLHIGAVGPKRVACGREGELSASPAKLVDNRESWLAFTDLVFVDPVGTGLSKVISDEAGDESEAQAPKETFYWDVEKDLDALCDFIAAFLSQEGRWSAPIYIAGESYGGYRSARLVRMLQEKTGIGLSGAMLISPVLEWDCLFASRFNGLAAAIRLPSYAAAARRHGRCAQARKGESLPAFLKRAETFALEQYLPSICADSGDGKLDDSFLSELSDWIGLDTKQLKAHNAMSSIEQFVRSLLRDEKKVLGLYDAGTITEDPFPGSDSFRGIDPTLGGLNRIFTVAANQHLRDNLAVDSENQYELLSYDVNRRWQWRNETTGSPVPSGALEDLAIGLGMNPDMQLSIVHGIYDLVTPYFESAHMIRQLRRSSALANAISLHVYEGGHMFYMWQKSRRDFTKDAASLYR